jgi:integrase/recombinase XerC/integrase/recombinase XerD
MILLLSDCFEKFIIYQKLKNNSPATIADYTVIVGRFIDYCHNIDCSELTADTVNGYNLYLRNMVKPISVRTYIRHITVFINFCIRKGFCSNIVDDIIMPKKGQKIVEVLTPDDVRLLLSVFGNDYYDIRNKAMVMLMLDCGLRAGEVIGLTCNNIDYKYSFVKVCGKGDKERIVPFGSSTRQALIDYAAIRPDVSSAYYFLNIFGEELTRSVFKKMFRNLRKRCGLPKLYPHLLRHTFATNYLLYSDGDIYKLSLLLGHADVQTTEIYLHYSNYYSFMQHKKSFSMVDKFTIERPLDSEKVH